MRFNLFAKSPLATFEGAPAVTLNAVQTLRRSVLSCLLWEDEFYADGQAIADRIAVLAADVDPAVVAALAIEARETFKLRHAPLMLLCALARTGSGTSLVSETNSASSSACTGAVAASRCPSRSRRASPPPSPSSTPINWRSTTAMAR